MQRKSAVLLPVLLLALLVGVFGCARTKSDPVARNAASPTATAQSAASPVPIKLTPTDLAKLKWIEGSWRGTGGGVPPFFERYKFENDSTLAVESLADESLSKVNDLSRFELKDGQFAGSDGESGSVATALDDNSITFAPTGKASNSFRFQRVSDNSWKAILNWTDKDGVAKERIYEMERWPKK
jgi:hypothetical protein